MVQHNLTRMAADVRKLYMMVIMVSIIENI